MKKTDKIYVAGHTGMVGSAIMRELKNRGYKNIIFKSHSELDLTDQREVYAFFENNKPDYVFLCAAKVGGIYANNKYKADFIYQNLMIEANIIHASYLYDVKKLLFLGSSCIYPKYSDQPIKESSLLKGPLEPTNQAYAIAKIAGIELCKTYREQYNRNFISVMPTNLYGPNDNYDPETSHVMAALIRKFIDAKIYGHYKVVILGSGNPEREFLHVDDLANACLFLMINYDFIANPINIGTGKDISIKELASKIANIVGYKGKIVFDTSKLDGTPKKLLDVSVLLNLGWKYRIELTEGIEDTIRNLVNFKNL